MMKMNRTLTQPSIKRKQIQQANQKKHQMHPGFKGDVKDFDNKTVNYIEKLDKTQFNRLKNIAETFPSDTHIFVRRENGDKEAFKFDLMTPCMGVTACGNNKLKVAVDGLDSYFKENPLTNLNLFPINTVQGIPIPYPLEVQGISAPPLQGGPDTVQGIPISPPSPPSPLEKKCSLMGIDDESRNYIEKHNDRSSLNRLCFMTRTFPDKTYLLIQKDNDRKALTFNILKYHIGVRDNLKAAADYFENYVRGERRPEAFPLNTVKGVPVLRQAIVGDSVNTQV